MIASRILRANGCANCRLSLLRRFVSIGGQRPCLLFPALALRSSPSTTRHERLFSSHDNFPQRGGFELEQSANDQVTQDNFENDRYASTAEFIETTSEDVDIADDETGALVPDSTPWYLQESTPERTLRPLSERQKIPELPERAPPILEPLLNQISIDLGLDSLTLLDLRKLDPPPALGANLIMVIGTARSERHLHASADRICRWLRSTYKLRPNADGLLGRNELKLKLRRKAKRAKLVGGSDENVDDGIRTGWVCVDVGLIEPGEVTDPVEEPQDFVGFGRRSDGVRLVVQMLTEEKREEIDLERLWGGILQRSTQKEGGVLEDIEVIEDGEDGAGVELASGASLITPGAVHPSSNPSMSRLSSIPSKRSFHTSARRLDTALSSSLSQTETKENALYDKVSSCIAAGDYAEAVNSLKQNSRSFPRLLDGGWKEVLQSRLLMYFQSVPLDEALALLGRDSADYSSTPFLESFYGSLSMYPNAAEVEMRIWFHAFAQSLGHTGYQTSGLIDLLRSLELNGADISRSAFKRLLYAVLAPPQGQRYGPARQVLRRVHEILQCMHSQGLQVIDEEILVELQVAAIPAEVSSRVSSKVVFELPTVPLSPLQSRLHALMMTVDLPCFSEATRLRLMDMYRSGSNWSEFWDVFRMGHQRGQPQSADMYAFMFASVAGSRHEKACVKALTVWITEMSQEKPPVLKEGQVAQAIRACLKVVDPFVEENANSDPESNNEWVVLWRACAWSSDESQRFLSD
jgi:ribosomal silencing factor RsfS